MFPDTEVAESFMCQSEIQICHLWLCSIFPSISLQDEVIANPYHVTSYDEGFMRLLYFEQIDFLIRFWHELKKHVVTWYLTCEFLQGAKADQIVNKFNNAAEKFNKTIQSI